MTENSLKQTERFCAGGGCAVDQITQFQTLIESLLNAKAQRSVRCHRPGIETCCIFDRVNQHYMLMDVGWDGEKRVEYITLHLRIKNDKIWIEDDWTEEGLATELMRKGVVREDIVLGFQHPGMRPYTDFAVA